MQNWQLALEDAIKCVAKDSNFIKGYFRLSIAQTELGQFEDAEITLRAVLAKEPGSAQYSSFFFTDNEQTFFSIRCVCPLLSLMSFYTRFNLQRTIRPFVKLE